ncbi:unnamed protein product [Boreogadus saida]
MYAPPAKSLLSAMMSQTKATQLYFFPASDLLEAGLAAEQCVVMPLCVVVPPHALYNLDYYTTCVRARVCLCVLLTIADACARAVGRMTFHEEEPGSSCRQTIQTQN